MTLFGAGLIAGGLALLGYAYAGARTGRRAGWRGRDWPAVDRAPGRLRGWPFIRRSALLDETVALNQDTVPIPPSHARAERAL